MTEKRRKKPTLKIFTLKLNKALDVVVPFYLKAGRNVFSLKFAVLCLLATATVKIHKTQQIFQGLPPSTVMLVVWMRGGRGNSQVPEGHPGDVKGREFGDRLI